MLAARLAGAAVFLVLVIAVEALLGFHHSQTEATRRMEASSFAGNLRVVAERELNAVMFLSNGLASYLTVSHNRLDDADIGAIQAELHRNSKNVRNFAIAEGTVIRWVYPAAGNEKALGFDYSRSESQWPGVKRAIDDRRGTLLGPVRLVQGGTGLIYRYPVFVKDKYWGMVSTVIDVDGFLRSGFDSVANPRYEFAVAVREDKGSPQVFWGNPSLFQSSEATLLEADVPNGTWVYAVRQKEAPLGHLLDVLLRLLGWTFAVLLGLAMYLLLKSRLELAQLALFDTLTNLPNRRLLEDRLHQAVSRHARRPASRCGLLFIDLNKFKAINDTHGHKAGDVVLQTVAQRIREEVRAGDTVARWGGDELVVVVEEADTAKIEQLVARLRELVTATIDFDGVALHVGVSVGVAIFPDDASSSTKLLKVADQRMYEDKQGERAEQAS
ncbi:MAG: diguanylate cyclase [Sulfuritalea sp.]|nr:diguanylate cyclase [Sulfuritalea sp.]